MDELQCNELRQFRREFKRLARKYKSLPDDLDRFIKVISTEPPKRSKRVRFITQHESFWLIKARLSCTYLKNSDLRIVFTYFAQERRVDLIEIYFKGDKENEDRERIEKYLKEQQDNA